MSSPTTTPNMGFRFGDVITSEDVPLITFCAYGIGGVFEIVVNEVAGLFVEEVVQLQRPQHLEHIPGLPGHGLPSEEDFRQTEERGD